MSPPAWSQHPPATSGSNTTPGTPGAIGYDNGGTRSLRFASLTWPKGQPAIAPLT